MLYTLQLNEFENKPTKPSSKYVYFSFCWQNRVVGWIFSFQLSPLCIVIILHFCQSTAKYTCELITWTDSAKPRTTSCIPCVCVCPSALACVCVYVVKFVVVIAVPCRTCLLYCFHRSFDRMHENQNDLLRIGRNKVKQTHISLHWLCFVWFYCDFFFFKKGPFSFPHNQLCSFSFLFLVCRFAPYIPVKYANGFFCTGCVGYIYAAFVCIAIQNWNLIFCYFSSSCRMIGIILDIRGHGQLTEEKK